MLYLAGVAFVLAMLLLFTNWWVSSARMDLTWAVRILIFIALALVLYDVCKKQPASPAPVKTGTAAEQPE